MKGEVFTMAQGFKKVKATLGLFSWSLFPGWWQDKSCSPNQGMSLPGKKKEREDNKRDEPANSILCQVILCGRQSNGICLNSTPKPMLYDMTQLQGRLDHGVLSWWATLPLRTKHEDPFTMKQRTMNIEQEMCEPLPHPVSHSYLLMLFVSRPASPSIVLKGRRRPVKLFSIQCSKEGWLGQGRDVIMKSMSSIQSNRPCNSGSNSKNINVFCCTFFKVCAYSEPKLSLCSTYNPCLSSLFSPRGLVR